MRRGGVGVALSVLLALGCAGAFVLPAALEVMLSKPPPRAPEPGEPVDAVEIIVDGASPDLVTFTDPATGCEYLVGRRGGVTPRLDAVGRPICRPAARTGGR